jgi:hypothetical protein
LYHWANNVVIEYLLAEVIELASNQAKEAKEKPPINSIIIEPAHIQLAIDNDEELKELFQSNLWL